MSQKTIESLKKKALNSYTSSREKAIKTLATFGKEALPALGEIAEKSISGSDLAMEKIKEINEGGKA